MDVSDAKLRSEMVMVVMFAGWYDVDRMLMLMMLMTNEGGGEESPYRRPPRECAWHICYGLPST